MFSGLCAFTALCSHLTFHRNHEPVKVAPHPSPPDLAANILLPAPRNLTSSLSFYDEITQYLLFCDDSSHHHAVKFDPYCSLRVSFEAEP